MRKLIPALFAAVVATFGLSSASHAAVINFAVSVLDGAGLGFTGPSLNASTAFNFDGASLLVSAIGPGDQSGLVAFPGTPSSVTLSPTDLVYGAGTGSAPLATDLIKSWTGSDGNVFTETLTSVESINRGTANAITVYLVGTVSDTYGLFADTPVHFILSANQVGGPGTAISAGFTNTTVVASAPELSTWAMMALGFAALGYAGIRRSRKDRTAFAA